MEPKTDYDNEEYDKFFSWPAMCCALRDIAAAIGIASLLIALWFIWVC